MVDTEVAPPANNPSQNPTGVSPKANNKRIYWLIAGIIIIFVLILIFDYGFAVPSLLGHKPFTPLYNQTTNTNTTEWANAGSYSNTEQSCNIYDGYVYCVGGMFVGTRTFPFSSDQDNYANVSSSGISNMQQTTNYPLVIQSESCTIYNSYIYCVGGSVNQNPYNGTNLVYYAPVSSDGIGTWKNTTSYPLSYVIGHQCVSYNGYLYCIVGNPGTSYYAPISSSGVGNWTLTTNYPLTNASSYSCATANGYVYCIGGATGNNTNYYDTNATYFAPLTATGIGAWNKTTNYPIPIQSGSCSIYNNIISCVGGYNNTSSGSDTNLFFYATVSNAGISNWSKGENYPLRLWGNSCPSYGGYVYCLGAGENVSNYDSNLSYYTAVK